MSRPLRCEVKVELITGILVNDEQDGVGGRCAVHCLQDLGGGGTSKYVARDAGLEETSAWVVSVHRSLLVRALTHEVNVTGLVATPAACEDRDASVR